MPGIRVQHSTHRNIRYTVHEPKVPYREPYQCTPPEFGGCGKLHIFKTHHLNLDDTGSCIVSTGVFDRIKDRLVLDGFAVGQEIKKPPAIGIGMAHGKNGKWRDIRIVESPGNSHK